MRSAPHSGHKPLQEGATGGSACRHFLKIDRRKRLSYLAVLLLVPLNLLAVEYGYRDPEFRRIPFEQWEAGANQSHFHASVDILPAELTAHQRMLSRIAIMLDGREVEKRRAQGEFIAFIQLQDSSGHVWQNHTGLNADNLPPALQTRNLVISHYAFLLPGDYAVTIVLWHSGTGEHQLIRRHLHVNALAKDPLPQAWEGLPAVEFVLPGEIPDFWYLPNVHSHLNLPVANTRPVQVDLLVNTTPSELASGSLTQLRRNMNLVIPAMRALSDIRPAHGSLNVSLLDLTHARVPFEQKNAGNLDWERMRNFFLDTKPGVVDVTTLANEWRMRKYFWDEVSRRMKTTDGVPHIVIVLSCTAFMTPQQESVEADWEPADPDHRLIYIRYRYDPMQFYAQRRMRPGARPRPMPPVYRGMPVDDLQKTLEPLHPRLLDALSAEQFRRIIAAVVEEISHF